MSCIAPACSTPAADYAFFSFPVYVSMLTLEDGSIVSIANGDAADADTYALIATVQSYAVRYGFTFTGLDLALEQAILRAMIFIEAFEPYFAGQRVSALQVLAWPRAYVPGKFPGSYLANNAIPGGLINALSEAAILELATPGVLTATIADSAQNVRRTFKRVGPLETETEYFGGASLSKQSYTRILAFLKPYLRGGGATDYSVRAH